MQLEDRPRSRAGRHSLRENLATLRGKALPAKALGAGGRVKVKKEVCIEERHTHPDRNLITR